MTNGLEPHQESAHVYYLSCVPLFKSCLLYTSLSPDEFLAILRQYEAMVDRAQRLYAYGLSLIHI